MLKPHDIATYNQLEAMLIEHGECCLIGIPGVGKTRISMHFIETYNLNALIITPRNAINDNWNSWGKILSKGSISTITMHTFHTSYKLFASGFDIYVIDECHCLGAKEWRKTYACFKELINEKCYIMGLTATPKRFFDDTVGPNDISETIFNSHRVYCMSRSEAVAAGIVNEYKYVCALYDIDGIVKEYSKKKMTEELKGRLDYVFKNQPQIREILIRHCPKDNRKGIVYVDSINSIKDGVAVINEAFPNEQVWYIHSSMNKSISDKIREEFRNSATGFLVNVDMVSEGIHYEGTNIVIMLRRTASPTKLVQQTGRISNTNKGIIFDFVANKISVDKTLNSVDNSKREFLGLWGNSERGTSDQNIVSDYISDIADILQQINEYNSDYWTPEEDEILKRYYPEEGRKVTERLPNRTEEACVSRASKLGIKYFHYWTPEEDEILKRYYPEEGSKVAKRLPRKTATSCQTRANLLGITCILAKQTWTPEEDEILKRYYPEEGRKVAERLPGRTPIACTARANNLNIFRDINIDWTPEEDEILKRYYPEEGRKVAERLPNRSISSCLGRAFKLGISHNSNKWTPEEDEIIRKYYPDEGTKVAKRLPGRDSRSCRARASTLKIKTNTNIWTLEEDEIIRKYYPIEGINIVERLPGRNKKSCIARARKLGVSSNRNWTPEEDEIIRKYYPEEGSKVAKRLPGRAYSSCVARASNLGIKYLNNYWTPEEDEIIRKYYPEEGSKVAKRLPGRLEESCRSRAKALNIEYTKKLARWTPEEDEIIINNYPKMGPDVSTLLPGRTKNSCKNRAGMLGVKMTR